MMRHFIFLVGFYFPLALFAQIETIQLNNFDEASPGWEFSTNVSFFNNGADGFFGIHNGDGNEDIDDTGFSDNALNLVHPNFYGDFLFINDLNDEGDNGTNGEALLIFQEIELTNFREVQINFDFETFNLGSTDYIKYQTIEDGKTNSAIELPKNDLGSIVILIPNSTKKLQLIFIIKQNGQTDYVGIDNISVQGNRLTPCNDLMISEYLEGSSSSGHRNNFIEIYNPTPISIDLENYDLVKYTGKSIEISSTLNITGFIPAFGTLLIEDIKENLDIDADISTNSSLMDFTGDDKIALRNSDTIIDLIGEIGDSVNFAKDITLRRKSNIQNPINQFDFSEWDIYELEQISDLNKHVSNCSGPIPEIEIHGNFKNIRDGSQLTSALNNTYFGSVKSGSNEEIVKSFYIKNIGDKNLEVSNIFLTGQDASDFSISPSTEFTIPPLDSTNISVTFSGNTTGLKTAQLLIENNDGSESNFNFTIQAEITHTTSSPLMITQYYEGTSNNKWIEITNISGESTLNEIYYIALFWNEDAHHPVGIKPSRNKIIPTLNAGETVKFRASLTVTQPSYALDGEGIKTSVCGFTGDDIIIISTTNDQNCWQNRLDIIGSNYIWGDNISFVRKYGCEGVNTNTGFHLEDWLSYELTEINSAQANTNQRIGNHFTGTTTFKKDLGWDNGLPDKYRDVVINHAYLSSVSGNLDCCNLLVNSNSTLSVSANNNLSVYNSLAVNGNLIIEHEGSLFMSDNDGTILNNGKIEVQKTTTSLKPFDYTYWSSPVTSATLNEVFDESPQNSFYIFNTRSYSDIDNDSNDDNNNAWQNTSGTMYPGTGYTAMAPNSEPFIDKQSVIFEGELNNGIIKVPIHLSEDNSSEYDDWNLIGNPYTSPIDANLFLNDPNNRDLINGSIYYWTHDTPLALGQNDEYAYSADDYAIYNIGTGGIKATPNGKEPTGIIASCQGFFVEAIAAGDLTFSNEIRQKEGNDNFFKVPDKKEFENVQSGKIWLNLSNKQGAFSQILIGFLSDAREDIESRYDAPRLGSNNFVNLYSIAKNQHLAIQGTTPSFHNKSIPLGYNTKIDGNIEFIIGVDHIEGVLGQKDIFLEDKVLKLTHNLADGDYVFTSLSAGTFNDRFLLKFSAIEKDIVTEEPHEDLLILANKAIGVDVRTSLSSIFSSIKVLDVLGRTIFDVEPYKKDFTIIDNVFRYGGLFIIQAQSTSGKIWNNKLIR